MSKWEWVRQRLTGALVVVAVGLLLRTAGVAHLYQYALNPLRTFETSLVELVSLTGWASAVVIAGYWFSRRGLRAEQLWRIATWCLVTMALMTAFVGYIVVNVSLGGGWLPDPTFTLLLGANVGAGVGVLLGWQRVRAIETVKRRERRETRTELLERQTRILTHLNSHLRHHMLDTVTVVDGYADLLESHVDEDGHRHLGPIRERNARTVDLLTNVDALVQALGTPPTLVTRDLSLVLRAAVSVARRDFPNATVDVDVATGVDVEADDLLDVVVANLLQNALVHAERDDPHVAVRLDTDDETARVTVADDGPGIPAAVREAVASTDGVPEATTDTGLGLYLATVVTQRYGSELCIRDGRAGQDDSADADASPGGTVVSFELQRASTPTPSPDEYVRPDTRSRRTGDLDVDSAISAAVQGRDR